MILKEICCFIKQTKFRTTSFWGACIPLYTMGTMGTMSTWQAGTHGRRQREESYPASGIPDPAAELTLCSQPFLWPLLL